MLNQLALQGNQFEINYAISMVTFVLFSSSITFKVNFSTLCTTTILYPFILIIPTKDGVAFCWHVVRYDFRNAI